MPFVDDAASNPLCDGAHIPDCTVAVFPYETVDLAPFGSEIAIPKVSSQQTGQTPLLTGLN